MQTQSAASTNQHQSKVAVRKTAHHTGTVADFPVQPLNNIVGADTSPVLAGKITISKSRFITVLHSLSILLQLHRAQFLQYCLVPLQAAFLIS